MKKYFQITILMLALLGLISCLAAIGPAADAKINKIRAMFDVCLKKEDGQDILAKKFKEMTGIELEINQPTHNQYNDKLLISFASNDFPDIVEIQPEHLEVYQQLVQEGAIIPLDKYLSKSKILKKIERKYFDALKVKGKIYGVPLNAGGGCVTYIRKDWLDNLKLKTPTTWNELYNVMKAFTFNDPDKNGKNDTYGTLLPGVKDSMYLNDFYMGARHDFYKVRGKWVDGFTQPNFRKALGRLVKAYQDKVIEPEVFTNQTSTCREKFFAGKAGIFHYWAGNWADELDHMLITKSGPKAKAISIPAVRGSHYWNRIGPVLVITKAAKDPEAVFKNVLEFMHDGGEGQMLFTHGVKNVHYKIENGEYKILPRLSNPTSMFTKAYIHPDLPLQKWHDPIPLTQSVIDTLKSHRSSAVQLQLMPYSKTYLKYAADIALLKEELIAKTMMGVYTVDTALKTYKEKSAKYEINKILKEFNQ